METKKERFSYLFTRYSDQTATPQEIAEFSAMVDQSMSDEELSSYLEQLWEDMQIQEPLFSIEKSEVMLGNILNSGTAAESLTANHRTAKRYIWLKVAATTGLIVTASFLGRSLWVPTPLKTAKTIKHSIAHDALPGGNRAILKLANGKTFSLDSSANGILANQGALKITKLANGQLLCTVNGTTSVPSANNLISTPRGGTYQIVLADGTKVWLNAASSLSFPSAFTGKTRNVTVTGEAYFEVRKNPGMPFIVTTKNEEIEVLGTHFDVSCYEDETASRTTLLEGIVKINSKGNTQLLKPGQQAMLLSNGVIRVNTITDAASAIAWKNGEFAFNDASIQEVMKQVSRWYDVSIVYEGKISTHQLTGSISRQVNASELLGMLSYAGIKFKIEGKKITIIN
jgi:transmembrane sensor